MTMDNAVMHHHDDIDNGSQSSSNNSNSSFRDEESGSPLLSPHNAYVRRPSPLPYSATPPTIEDWDDAYANERVGRLLITMGMMIIASMLSPAAVSIVHDIAPRHPLPDTVFQLIPEQEWAMPTADTLVTVAAFIVVIIAFIHRYRYVVLRRTFFLAAVLYGLRTICLMCTQLPVAFNNATEHCRPQIFDPNFTVYLYRFITKWIAFGTSDESGDLCGDMLFSGHTIVFTMAYLNARTYLPKRLQSLVYLIAPMSIFGYWMTLGLYTLYHLYAHLAHDVRRRTIGNHVWLLGSVNWMEKPVPAGRLPNRLSWPWSFPPGLDRALRQLSDPPEQTLTASESRTRFILPDSNDDYEAATALLHQHDNDTPPTPNNRRKPYPA